MRLETQNTIETLREEFDQLVKELAKYKQKDKGGNYGDDSSPTEGPRGGASSQQPAASQKPKGMIGIPKLKLSGNIDGK